MPDSREQRHRRRHRRQGPRFPRKEWAAIAECASEKLSGSPWGRHRRSHWRQNTATSWERKSRRTPCCRRRSRGSTPGKAQDCPPDLAARLAARTVRRLDPPMEPWSDSLKVAKSGNPKALLSANRKEPSSVSKSGNLKAQLSVNRKEPPSVSHLGRVSAQWTVAVSELLMVLRLESSKVVKSANQKAQMSVHWKVQPTVLHSGRLLALRRAPLTAPPFCTHRQHRHRRHSRHSSCS